MTWWLDAGIRARQAAGDEGCASPLIVGPRIFRPLSGGVTKNWAYGGMTLAGDRIVLVHDNGLVKIFPVNDTFAPMEACAIPDDVYAHPVAQGRSLYIRSLNALWRFETK